MHQLSYFTNTNNLAHARPASTAAKPQAPLSLAPPPPGLSATQRIGHPGPQLSSPPQERRHPGPLQPPLCHQARPGHLCRAADRGHGRRSGSSCCSGRHAARRGSRAAAGGGSRSGREWSCCCDGGGGGGSGGSQPTAQPRRAAPGSARSVGGRRAGRSSAGRRRRTHCCCCRRSCACGRQPGSRGGWGERVDVAAQEGTRAAVL